MFDYENNHLNMLRTHLSECTVLLRYDGKFPVSAPCKVALYGSGARGTVKGGTGSGEVNSRFFVNVEDGLKERGFTITTSGRGGWLDRYDVSTWAKVAHNIFKDDFMVIHGVSMGAATVMMMSGDPQPEYIKAYIEDCGYSSVWDQFKSNLHQSFHLPPFPILNSASIVCKNRYGWSFKEASSVKQLAKCDRPMLFIHGDADDFVPFSHLQANYDAKVNGYKEMWVAEGAVHANSFAKHPEEYKQHVKDFLQRVRQMQ